MKVLVTGGTGIVCEAVTGSLLARGHSVRFVSRNVDEHSTRMRDVDLFPANLSDPSSLRGCAQGCEVALHISGIATETPPHETFEKINVQGTQNLLNEALASGVRRFVYVSSLGADRGTSEYHKSKLEAEKRVRHFPREWVILRPGSVFGPGDDVVSLLLKKVRTLPSLPIPRWGDQQFQPIWYNDLADAAVRATERKGIENRILELGGSEVTSMNDLLDRLYLITGRRPARIPVPNNQQSAPLPIEESRLRILLDGNVIRIGSENALASVLNIHPTPLQEALEELANSTPE